MASHGKPPNLDRLVIRAILPFESGAITYFFFIRVSPSTESGQGLSRRQTCVQETFSFSVSPSILNSSSSASRIIRCRSSSLVQGISPLRTLSIVGLYPRRQRSAKSAQLMFRPLALPQAMPSAITEPRQSTTVPNVSNTSAFTLASSGFTSCGPRVACCARTGRGSEKEIAAAPAPAASRNFRRSGMSPMSTHFPYEPVPDLDLSLADSTLLLLHNTMNLPPE